MVFGCDIYDALRLRNSNDKLAINTMSSIPGKVMESLISYPYDRFDCVRKAQAPKLDFKDAGSAESYRIYGSQSQSESFIRQGRPLVKQIPDCSRP